ncbi:hypothetical protein IQ07DRAFT_201249 [Pyrenochaeta sp. DS3sAY3a]|nr:hypothetical protein IQ07DRAFT_201249 [Pyrenochaeta sp. DS3sAY3a]
MIPRILTTQCTLEVERKFACLGVPNLINYQGQPPFSSIAFLGHQKLHDIYYDRSRALSMAGLYVRRRNGTWQAKLRRGGNYLNSSFEEISNPIAISDSVAKITGHRGGEHEHFGLGPIADMTTFRKTWLAEQEFTVVLDTMDFGHVVGEVEIEKTVTFGAVDEEGLEEQRRTAMKSMDERIGAFMKRYAWAFGGGVPKGKLTAYFEKWPKHIDGI